MPHRAHVLQWLAAAALVCAALAVFVWVPAVFGVLLGGGAWALALWDCQRIEDGEMDPRGEELTEAAARRGRLALILNTLVLFGWPVVAWFALWLVIATGLVPGNQLP